MHVLIDQAEWVFINVYAPTKNTQKKQIQFANYLRDHLVDYADKKIIIGGDFNTCLDPKIDKKGGTQEARSLYSDKLNNLMTEFNLCDIYRLQHPNVHHYTWRNKGKGGWVQSRLDMFLVSLELQYQDIKSSIHPSIKSDHSLIQIVFTDRESWVRGRGFYKFNVKLLEDREYIEKVNNKLIEMLALDNSFTNKALFWDYIKCEIRGLTVAHSSFKAKERRRNKEVLLKDLRIIEKQMGETPTTDLLDKYVLETWKPFIVFKERAV